MNLEKNEFIYIYSLVCMYLIKNIRRRIKWKSEGNRRKLRWYGRRGSEIEATVCVVV